MALPIEYRLAAFVALLPPIPPYVLCGTKAGRYKKPRHYGELVPQGMTLKQFLASKRDQGKAHEAPVTATAPAPGAS